MKWRGNPLRDRFWANVPITDDGCWEWLGGLTGKGYGQISAGGRGGAKLMAHRVAWEVYRGPIPAGMVVCHRCDNPRCVRPSHLALGTQSENIRDMHAKGRGARGKAPPGYPTGDAHWSHQTPERVLRGQRHGMSKLTAAQVTTIRRRYAAGGIGYYLLAKEYGVTEASIRNIVKRRTWEHL